MYAVAKADIFVKQARVNGNISSVMGAAEGYIAQKEQERAERIEAYRAWRVEHPPYVPPSQPALDLQAGLQALYEGRKAGEVQLEDVACTPENIQKPKNLLEKGRLWLEEITGRIAPGLNLANTLSPLEFRERVDGRFSVAVNQELALKKSGDYLDDIAKKGFEFNPAGGYKPSTLLGKTTKGTLNAAVPGGLDILTTGLFNAYDYTFGEKKGETDKLQQWAVSTGVDLGGSLLTGALAAGAVALFLTFAPVTFSATAIVVATVVTGVIFDVVLEAWGVKEPIKAWINQQVDKAEPAVSSWVNSVSEGLKGVFNKPAVSPAQPPSPRPTPPSPQPPQTATPPTPSPAPTTTPSPSQAGLKLPPDSPTTPY